MTTFPVRFESYCESASKEARLKFIHNFPRSLIAAEVQIGQADSIVSTCTTYHERA